MRKPRSKFNRENLVTFTTRSKQRVSHIFKLAEILTDDDEKRARLKKQYCLACFYLSGLAGQALTNQECMACGEDQTYSSTATDVLCHSCAVEHSLCKCCGGDIKLKTTRRKWPV